MLNPEKLISACTKAYESGSVSAYESVVVEYLPEQTLTITPPVEQPHLFWKKPHEGLSLLGLGEFDYQRCAGAKRFEQLRLHYQQLSKGFDCDPFSFLCFAFDDEAPMENEWNGLDNAFLLTPRILFTQKQDRQLISVNLSFSEKLQPQMDELVDLLSGFSSTLQKKQFDAAKPLNQNSLADDQENWSLLGNKALEQLHKGEFSKLVISRRRRCEHPDAGLMLERLAERYPDCTIISCLRDDKQLIAATPERLLSLQQGQLHSDAIGGTLSYEQMQNCDYIVDNGSELTRKLIKEHAIIVKDICQRLEPLCHSLTVPTAPQLRKLHRLFHLQTPISAVLGKGQSLLSLAERLHPTPAIAGFPAQASVNWLRQNEGYERGWYGGLFGWMQGENTGEVSLLLRCALLHGRVMDLYAGAGLVIESDIEQEWLETEMKMQTILDLV